jgi:hypothetical protein
MSGRLGNQPLPGNDIPVTAEDGRVTEPWRRFFLALWQKTGASNTTVQNFLFLQQTSAGLQAYTAGNPTVPVGTIPTTGGSGLPPQPLTLASSPFVYSAVGSGTLVVDSGLLEIKRGSGGTWYTVSLVGGALPLLAGDFARITWNGSSPVAVWMGT